ncbi:MAG TPA: TRIC cation channel family protein [Caulifigura sp.]|jgi:uncharacterized membrane protein YeiH|nr:TRIC cation channel family protein [Caulifigura sp.]
MPPDVFLLPPTFDYAATLFWAISGALVGARRGYDIIGVFILALVSATGGGLLRDGLFLQEGTPLLLRTPTYLILVAVATTAVMIFGKRVTQLYGFQRIVDVVDALGLGAYAVVGMNLSLVKGLNPAAAMLVGMVNATGGAILRSVISGREPHLFRPGKLEAVAALIGCALYLSMRLSGLANPTVAAWVTIVAVFVIRVASVAYGVTTRPVQSFEEEWRQQRPLP